MNEEEKVAASVRSLLTSYSDFPKPGVLFRDVFPLFQQPSLVQDVLSVMSNYVTSQCGKVDLIVGIESRGFLFAVPLSLALNVPFAPIRKKGKLPGPTEHVTIKLEYGIDTLEMQKGIIKKGDKVVIIDDLLATGGTLHGACQLVEQSNGEVAVCLIMIELLNLNGRNNIKQPIHSILKYH